jgi:hypothetical protein
MTKKLPIGIQSFAVLCDENYLYVDKTESIYKMVTSGRIYFLSRPRYLGKSLSVNALDALFSGLKDLFEGLFIYYKWNWTQQYSVIRLDFEKCAFSSPKEMQNEKHKLIFPKIWK